jgi:hypothetical protein
LRLEPLEPRTLLTRFAMIGDYGDDSSGELAVANLVKSWNPEFITTQGDNNYPDGEASTIDANIGKYYHEYIYNYQGVYGAGSPTPRFFPTLGNHDWHTRPGGLPVPYLDYFTLPGPGFTNSSGNERYYEFRWGDIHFFMIDSDDDEPHGRSHPSVQSQWMQGAVAASDAPWKFVMFHHMPYESNDVDPPTPQMLWPFAQWGVDISITGHEHVYERFVDQGYPWIANGLGGRSIYDFEEPIDPHSISRYNSEYGAMRADVDAEVAKFSFFAVDAPNQPVDSLHLYQFPVSEQQIIAPNATWRYLVTSADPGPAWRGLNYNDSAWAQGAAILGYGGGQNTTIGFGGDPDNKNITTYFRRTFQVSDPTQYRELALRLTRDDGAVVYLNGLEVARHSMPTGSIGHNTLASHRSDFGEEDSTFQLYIDAARLQPGQNVLAVEVHQAAVDSSDLLFRAELVGIVGGPDATVVGRKVFYNNSAWDGNNPAAGPSDDAAIAPDKAALVRGQTASLANYTSYSRGINGLMIDVENLGGAPTAADFVFKVGNDNNPATWATLAAQPTVSVRAGAGVGGSDRVTLVWPDGTIKKKWLEVTVLATAATGLAQPDVFYFGNAMGEVGNTTANAQVNATDEGLIRLNGRNALNPAPIDFRFDINRDKLVGSTDQALARLNATTALNRLVLIAPPAGAAPASAARLDLAALAQATDPAVFTRKRRRG